MQKDIMNDRLLGMIIGGYLGEALAGPFRYLSYTQLDKKNILEIKNIPKTYKDYHNKLEYATLHPYRKNKYKPRIYPIGTICDSSVLTNHIFSSIAKNKEYIKDDVLKRYLDMSLHNPMIDSHTRKVFNYKTVEGYYKCTNIDINNTSYSSLSRCSPLMIYDINNNNIVDDIKLSHQNDLNIWTNKIYLSSLRNIVNGDHKDIVIEKAIADVEAIESIEIRKSLHVALDQAKMNIIRNVNAYIEESTKRDKKSVLHPFYAAYWSLYHFDSYVESMEKVLYLGGQTDTNMKVAGEIVGLYEGYTRLVGYEHMLDNVKILFQVNSHYMENIEDKVKVLNDMYR
jgi:ADP-ribosylglycohydrolase